MSEFFLLLLILALLGCLLLTVGVLVVYSGLISDIDIKTGSPPIRNVTFAYKFKEGPYKDSGAVYTESSSIGPKLKSMAVFYDDSSQGEEILSQRSQGSEDDDDDDDDDQEQQCPTLPQEQSGDEGSESDNEGSKKGNDVNPDQWADDSD